jgi:hypothetical protein
MIFPDFRVPFLLKIFLVVLLITIFSYFIFSRDSRKHFFSYFSTHCIDYKQKDFSRKLNDKVVDYSAQAKLSGIIPCKDEKEFQQRISDGRLIKVKSSNKYVIDRMTYSYPYITKGSKLLLDEIASRFREKTSQKGLNGARFIITSMTRKTENIRLLRKYNVNASVNSPHLYGNTFDISYKRFIVRKWVLTNCDKKFLKEVLAEVIWELSEEKKCWATYERMQNCYHVVCR